MKAECAILGVYSFHEKEHLYLIEVFVNEAPTSVDFSSFYQRDNSLSDDDWQTAYDEHYLSSDGETVIGDSFDRCKIPGDTTRAVFFMYLYNLICPLSTPYGDYQLNQVQKIPARLSRIIKYDPVD